MPPEYTEAVSQAQTQIQAGERFAFGHNWKLFLDGLNEPRILQAQRALAEMLGQESLAGCRFLDAGCGSGLSSLVARRMGAQVYSFDFDPESVACAEELRRRYFPGDTGWTIETGSVLDGAYLSSLGQFEIVYSWGVLHHTGAMWHAMENLAPLVAEGGQLFIAIYNDQGSVSNRWRTLKRTYNALPAPLRPVLTLGAFGVMFWRRLLKDALQFQPLRTWRTHSYRGMSLWRDVVDWVGGYPFEVARPEQILDFYRPFGFELTKLRTCNNSGCNELVFTKHAAREFATERVWTSTRYSRGSV